MKSGEAPKSSDSVSTAMAFEQLLRRLDVEAGEVHGLAVGADVAELVGRHMLAPARKHGDDGALGDVAVGRGPRLDVVRRHLRVGIVGRLRADVDDDQRRHEVLDRQFGHRLAVGRKVQRRVDVRAGVLGEPPFVQVEGVFLVVELLLDEELLGAEIGRERLEELVRQVGRLGRRPLGEERRRRRGYGDRGRTRRNAAGKEAAAAEHVGLDVLDHAMMAHVRYPPG